jgi:hypothetical protein
VLSDEVEPRDHKNLTNRLQDAGFEEECTLHASTDPPKSVSTRREVSLFHSVSIEYLGVLNGRSQNPPETVYTFALHTFAGALSLYRSDCCSPRHTSALHSGVTLD